MGEDIRKLGELNKDKVKASLWNARAFIDK